jgi:asparagine synthase (glutamine-hydrolysing)
MCGFAGEFLLAAGRADRALARRMASLLRHRGPDEESDFLSADGRCAIGFERLAVIDVAGSHQPMSTADGQATIAFNGEIYNFRELRRELEAVGCVFRTAGDTEVLLELYRRHGEEMVQRLRGMFAFAIYDASRGRLFLARDHFGQKPLWYAMLPDRIVFASEAKALLAHPMVDRSLDRQSILYYLTLGYIPAPRSAWTGIRKLPPASSMTVAASAEEPSRYWMPRPGPPAASPAEWIERTRAAVEASVRRHMVSDVPLGALLSGGLDSSIVVALMAREAGRAGGVRTFTAGFDDPRFDERPAARQLAAHCGTQHTELLIHPEPGDVLSAASRLYDEPFGDSSAAATWLVCREARKHVTVALAGDGGDEIFAGYDRYAAMHMSESIGPARYLLLRIAGAIAGVVAPHEERSPLRRLARYTRALPYPYPQQYLAFRSLFAPADFEDLLSPSFLEGVAPEGPQDWFWELYESQDFDDEVARCQWHDMMTYLPDDLLVKTDIASMDSSLELRAPLLDPKLAEIGLAAPADLKLSGRRGKQILRRAFGDLLPSGAISSPKRGFGLPLGTWLRGDLRQDMERILLGGVLTDTGIFRSEAIHGLVNDHVSGKDDHRHRLWALMMLARWLGDSKRSTWNRGN